MIFQKNRFQRHYPFVQFFGIALLVATVNLAATAQSPDSFSVSIENFGKVNDQYYRASPTEVGRQIRLIRK